MQIEEKTALVTGGANGIGFAFAVELLRNGAAHVAILDLANSNGEEAAKKLNSEFGKGKAIFAICDVTKPEELEAGFAKAVKEFGGLDIVFNNAGIVDCRGWELMISVNFTAVVRGTLLSLQYMGKDKGGRGGAIINMSSIAGIIPIPVFPIYAATKHAVIGLSRSFAKIAEGRNSVAYDILPLVTRPGCREFHVKQTHHNGGRSDKILKLYDKQQPLHYERTDVRILTICPGLTDTKLAAQSTLKATESISLEEAIDIYNQFPMQTPEIVAQGVLHVIRVGESGSVWVTEDGKPIYEIEVPDQMVKKELYFYEKTEVSVLTLCPGVMDTQLITKCTGRSLEAVTPEVIETSLKAHCMQKVDSVARAMVHIIRVGETGSVWYVQSDEPVYEIESFDYPVMKVPARKKVAVE